MVLDAGPALAATGLAEDLAADEVDEDGPCALDITSRAGSVSEHAIRSNTTRSSVDTSKAAHGSQACSQWTTPTPSNN